MFLHRGEDERIVCDNKRNATGLVCGSLTGFECFIGCDCVISLDFLFEKERLYPRSLRYLLSSLARNVKLSSKEHMARFVCRG